MNNISRTPENLNKYEIARGTISPSNGDYGPFLNAAAYYSMYPKVIDYEMHVETARAVSRQRVKFMGEMPDLLDIFDQTMSSQTTTKSHIEVKIELPADDQYIRVLKVHVPANKTKVGERGLPFDVTIDTRAANRKSWFVLREYPNIVIRPKNDRVIPDGKGGKYEMVIANYKKGDYISVSKLRNSELLEIAAPLEEAAVDRGTFDMRGFGRAFIHYRFDMTRMGWEKKVTDKYWQAAEYFMMEAEHVSEGVPKSISISEIDANFFSKCEVIFDRYMMAGPDMKLDNGVITDDMNKTAYELGPSALTFIKANGADEYSYYSQSVLDDALDKFQRDLDLSAEDSKDMVYHIVTGTTGYRDVIQPGLKAKDDEIVHDKELSYKIVDSIGGQGRIGVIPGRKQIVGGYLETYGEYRVHISEMLNKGILCGNEEWRGFPISASWIIIFAGKKETESGLSRASNFTVHKNEVMAQRGHIEGTWSPSGPTNGSGGQGARKYPSQASDAGMGNLYKCICEMYEGIYLNNFSDVRILFPDIKLQRRA